MSYLYIKLKKVDAVLVKRRINGAKSKSHLFFFASAFLSQCIPPDVVVLLHTYDGWQEKKYFFQFLQYGAFQAAYLEFEKELVKIRRRLVQKLVVYVFFLVRLVHIRSWYASLDDRASERKRNLHKTHFKNMPPNFWCNI